MKLFTIQSVIFFAAFFAYSWILGLEYGFFTAIHYTILTLSFFVLATPAGSFFYSLGFWPSFSSQSEEPFIGSLAPWVVLGLSNILYLRIHPEIYTSIFILRILNFFLLKWPINFFIMFFSLGCLLIHWLLSKIPNRQLKAICHGVGFVASSTIYWFIIHFIQEELVDYLLKISLANY